MGDFLLSVTSYLTGIRLPYFTWSDIVEILLIAFFVYEFMLWIRNTRAYSLLKGILIVLAFIFIAFLLKMNTILWLVTNMAGYAITAVLIIFQPELRKALEELGHKKIVSSIIPFDSGNKEEDGYFSEFISNGTSTEVCFLIFAFLTVAIIYAGVRNGVERVSKFMMPVLVFLSVLITVYSVTRPGALAGVKYFLVPNIENFSWMTVVAAMGQMFYSLSIAMGILVTFGSYMKKDVSIEGSTKNVEVFDTAIAIMAGLMIIPAVFAFSGGDPDTLQAGPALMFITIPKVFASMGLGTPIGILFFVLVLCAALTSSIALTESAVSTFQDELRWHRKKATVIVGVIMILLGTLSSLGYGPLGFVKIIGMQFLDFFDFLTNSVMMPIAAIAICLLVSRVIGVQKIEEEVTLGGKPFRRKKIFNFMIQYLCPIFAAIILISSVANALGWIAM